MAGSTLTLKPKKKRLGKTLLVIWASVFLIVAIFPYIYMVLQSLAPWDQVDKVVFPSEFTLRSFDFLLTGGNTGMPRPWLNAFANSIIVSLTTTLLSLGLAMLLGYAITKLRFRGSKLVNNFILFQMFFPAVILLVPTFMVSKFLGMNNTYFGMIIPKIISAWAIFMYVNFYRTIPDEVLEAARMDGASEWQVVFRIVFPMTKSITTILFLFLFMERWGELLWDMIIVKSENLMTLNVLLATMKGPYGSFPGPLYAGAVLLTVPILILFIIFSKNFSEGMNYVTK
ncbi:carbohydrate ABC transporter permease [Culicoidibacter larvae]|uniref:Carbohydrate ABC transporter permease n=1 Tax=Culicoidibacter larvae TaxID=2579976 RepID=A0A5R8QCU7_9FIRM|nr:carbohydrate ABC transporter permease [Culicoidibacter larvae]TLG72932.1 carbohydrate ABC transporter permease [Culicoidibacter larvae]